MTTLADISCYVQGYRFADEPGFYDAANKRFLDLAGYGAAGDVTVTLGSPVFETVGVHRAAKLNNTWHGVFNCPIPWQGSVLAVIKPSYTVGATVSRFPLLFGDFAAPTSNGVLILTGTSGERRVGFNTGAVQIGQVLKRTDDNTVVVAFSTDQLTRSGYMTRDGITVTPTSGPASTLNGNAIAMGSGQYGVRLGNMSGVAGDLTEVTGLTCHLFELHFFSENVLIGPDLSVMAAAMAELKTKYSAN